MIFHRTKNLVVSINSGAQMLARLHEGFEGLLRPVHLGHVAPRNIQSSSHLLLILRGDCNGLPSRGDCFTKASPPDLIFEDRGICSVSILDIQPERAGVEIDALNRGAIERLIIRPEYLLEVVKGDFA